MLYIDGDFNIRDTEWDLSVFAYSTASQVLIDLADLFDLMYLLLALSVSTYYLNTNGHTNSVIDLIFFRYKYFSGLILH